MRILQQSLKQQSPVNSLWLISILHGTSFLYHELWNIETWNWSTTILDYSVNGDRKINVGEFKLDLRIFCRFQLVMIFKSDFLARSKIGWYSNSKFFKLSDTRCNCLSNIHSLACRTEKIPIFNCLPCRSAQSYILRTP